MCDEAYGGGGVRARWCRKESKEKKEKKKERDKQVVRSPTKLDKSAGWGWRSGGERGGRQPISILSNGGDDCWVDSDVCTSGLIHALKILANTHAHIDTQQNTGFSRFGLLFASFPFFQVRRIVCVHLRSRKELPSSPNKDEDFRDHIFMFCCPAHLSHLKI